MDNQIVTKENLVPWVATIVMAILVVLLLLLALGMPQLRRSDPYVESVLALQGDPVQGNAIFQMNCAGCHGTFANGRVGPSLRNVGDRKSKASLIHQVISGQTPPMPQFQPTAQEMADLLSYLESL
ncbi:c-type cytochrome [Pantanalinema sp. GBBB05]|uniref:c-type cytochrome n=1 Tax=Pantanalinema sp. GBBB05 TaxID=2604139 RepID=UPI001DF8222B|nr:cytochrome c [Pantanalinema sp. GBBB05]